MLLEGIFKKNAAGQYKNNPDLFLHDISKAVADLLSCIRSSNKSNTKQIITPTPAQHK